MADKNKLFLGTNKDTYIAADDAGNIIFQTEHGSRAVVDTEGMKVGVNGAAPVALGAGGSSFEKLSETVTPAVLIGEAATIATSVAGGPESNYYQTFGDRDGRVRFDSMQNEMSILWLFSNDSEIFNNSNYFNKSEDSYGNITVSVVDTNPEDLIISNFNSYFNDDLITGADSYGNGNSSLDAIMENSFAYTNPASFSSLIANKNIYYWSRISSDPQGVEINGNKYIPIQIKWKTNDISGFNVFNFGDNYFDFTDSRNAKETPFDLEFSSPEISEVSFTSTSVIMSGLPTEDPEVAGALWNSNGTLRVSTGAGGAGMP